MCVHTFKGVPVSVAVNPQRPHLGKVTGKRVLKCPVKAERGVSHPAPKIYAAAKFGSKEIISLKKHLRDKK